MKNSIIRNNVLVIIILAALFTLPFYAGAYTLTTFIRIFYFGLLSLSVGMLIGQLGVVSMAHTAFFAMGAYVVGLIGYERGVPFPWADIIGVVFTMVAAFLFGMVAMRTRDMVFMMITLAFGQVLWSLGTQNTSLLHGWLGIVGIRPYVIFGIDFNIQQNFYWAALIIFLVCLLLYRMLTKTPFGLALNGIRENPRRMASLGYPVYWMKVAFFVFSALFAALGGILMFYNTGIITPSAMHMSRTSWILLCVILGGAGYFWGPVVGTILAVWFDVWISQITMRYNTILGIIFVLIVLFSPSGILGILNSWWKKRFLRTINQTNDQDKEIHNL
jgi:branched-chain amino acid transport system permease protein